MGFYTSQDTFSILIFKTENLFQNSSKGIFYCNLTVVTMKDPSRSVWILWEKTSFTNLVS